MTDAPHILVAEDDAAVREGLEVLFAAGGYRVTAARDGEAALAAGRAEPPDVWLLDVNMPRLNGFAVCRAVRAADEDVPILFLTARDGETDELCGLGFGADDWISKTASDAVLLARVAAALRRRVRKAADAFPFGPCRVDVRRQMLIRPEDEVRLTVREVEMLRQFSNHPGEIFSTDGLLARFWGVTFAGTDTALRVALARLRVKLGTSDVCLKSVRGDGYFYDPAARRA